MEGDAEVKSDKEEKPEEIPEEEIPEENEEEIPDDESMEDDEMGDDEDDESLDDEESTEDETPKDPEVDTKKLRLFEDFKKILSITESIKGSIETLDLTLFSTQERKVFDTLITMTNDNIKKLEFIILYQYNALQYEKLLTIYLYIKSSALAISEILKNILKN